MGDQEGAKFGVNLPVHFIIILLISHLCFHLSLPTGSSVSSSSLSPTVKKKLHCGCIL